MVRYQPETSTRLPRWLIVLVVVLCLAPWPAAGLGVDLASATVDATPVVVGDLDTVHRVLAGSFWHTTLEWTAFCAALVTVLLAAVHFRITGSVATPVLAVALLCAACMDGFSTLAAVRLLGGDAPLHELVPFTWALSRLGASVVMTVGAALVLLRRTERVPEDGRFVVLAVIGSGLLACLTIGIGATSRQLPQTLYPEAAISRPFDLIPLAVFAFVATPLFCVLHARQRNLFTHALVISLLPAVASQASMAFGSAALFDAWFNIAHFLKVVAYTVPLAGLIMDYDRWCHQNRVALDRLADSERLIHQANRELSAANEELERFVYTVSHDLKSPIVTIQGFVGHLRRDLEAGRHDRIDGFADRIANASVRMRDNIDDLLQLSRIGRVTGPAEIVDMNDLAREIVEDHSVEERLVDVSIEIDDDLPALRADRLRIAQIVDNLITNALKYGCTAPKPVIRLGAVLTDDDVRYFLRDNGPGIPIEARERIFDLFQRLDHGGDGSGIGLAIVKRIAEVHGGRAWVESEPGAGSTFWVSLPREIAVPADTVRPHLAGACP